MESQKIEAVSVEKKPELNEFQISALKDAEQKLEDLRKEHSIKKYLVDIKKEDLTILSNFISADAPWKFTECLGIIEVSKQLKECSKSGKFFTGAIAIEAIYYYMSKVDGKGNTPSSASFGDIETYIRILKGITGAIEKIKADSEIVKNAEFVAAARREGIDPDSSIK